MRNIKFHISTFSAKLYFSKKNTGSSKKMDGIWNRYNLKSTGRIYTFGVLKVQKSLKF